MTIIKREESVLVAIALFLLAGVIIYNVFFTPTTTDVGESETSTTTRSSTTIVETSTTMSESSSLGVDEKEKVNINTADIKELTSLTGIGEVKAQAIIDYRENYGPFPSVNSLTNVSGIGDKTLAKIIDKITV